MGPTISDAVQQAGDLRYEEAPFVGIPEAEDGWSLPMAIGGSARSFGAMNPIALIEAIGATRIKLLGALRAGRRR
jgi:hypothetical protein